MFHFMFYLAIAGIIVPAVVAGFVALRDHTTRSKQPWE